MWTGMKPPRASPSMTFQPSRGNWAWTSWTRGRISTEPHWTHYSTGCWSHKQPLMLPTKICFFFFSPCENTAAHGAMKVISLCTCPAVPGLYNHPNWRGTLFGQTRQSKLIGAHSHWDPQRRGWSCEREADSAGCTISVINQIRRTWSQRISRAGFLNVITLIPELSHFWELSHVLQARQLLPFVKKKCKDKVEHKRCLYRERLIQSLAHRDSW